ncbi:MAG: hypothetical protein JWQ13_3705 [Ramlibacter sp.]|nr:hypothetical protein [Ramlibacter sp.]
MASVRRCDDVPDWLKAIERQVELLEVVFNNNYEDQGQRNGQALMDLLQGDPR